MPDPIIGLTTSRSVSATGVSQFSLYEVYIQAVQRAGGIPILIPANTSPSALEQILPHLDGLLLTGGGDIDPAHFDGQAHPRVYDIDPERDDLELALVQRAARSDLPFLGICRGAQVINVALGGTLYTDIGDQHPQHPRHDFSPGWPRSYPAHLVSVKDNSRLFHLLNSSTVEVNSLHHQGILDVAPALQASAFAPDGLVEGVELPGHVFGVGVQWHPEWLVDSAPMQSLFRAFVESARR